MGKADKAQAVSAGRVPLVQGNQPLLYPRYNTIEDLLKLGKKEEPKAAEINDNKPDGRPSKKQKRSATVPSTDAEGQVDDEPAATAPVEKKGFSAVGEDGLTYKQRRQMRRAAERAAKAQAEAEAGAAGAANDAAGAPEAQPGGPEPAQENGAPTKEEPKRKKQKNNRGQDGEAADGEEARVLAAAAAAAAAAATTAAAAAKGNADEAARMRAVLGFTSAGAGAASGVTALKLAPTTLLAAEEPGSGVDAAGKTEAEDTAGASKKRSKKDKASANAKSGGEEKEKKDTKKGHGAEEEDKEGEQVVTEQEAPGVTEAKPGAAKPGKKAAAVPAVRPGKRPAGGATVSGHRVFSFDFKVTADVEAATEARLAKLMAIDSSKDGFVPRRVWVSGLPHEFAEDTIREYWSYCGEVESMHLLTFSDSGNFNGTAFITFKTQEGYEAALACQGEMLEGRPLRVEKCKAAAELKGKARAAIGGPGGAAAVAGIPGACGAGSGAPAGRVPGYPVAYCGNISFEAGVEELQDLFKKAGAAPTKVRLHTDKVTGRSKGFAHVHFGSDEDVDKAVAVDGSLFHGRKIRVSYAQPKPGES